jgi:hypothetical protein
VPQNKLSAVSFQPERLINLCLKYFKSQAIDESDAINFQLLSVSFQLPANGALCLQMPKQVGVTLHLTDKADEALRLSTARER